MDIDGGDFVSYFGAVVLGLVVLLGGLYFVIKHAVIAAHRAIAEPDDQPQASGNQ
ncbi:hypothetical protein KXS11_03400 [Plantibacter flavus]|uniref:hypothetical protein n=1 Tax=Plantibacter flavus TaxID=150123 RepID=UPI003F137AD3